MLRRVVDRSVSTVGADTMVLSWKQFEMLNAIVGVWGCCENI